MDNKYVKIHTTGCNAPLKVTPGHFATNHAHINYYLDMTTLKTRLSEAKEIAGSLSGLFLYDTVVDTIVCLEGTQVIGSFLAEELTSAGVLSMNAHKTIYIVTPEFNSNSQMIFKENILPMIRDKNVIILTASVTTGLALNKGIESIRYYGGNLRAVTAIFSTLEELNGYRITSIFGRKDLPDYTYYDYRDCPLRKQGKKLDALVNAYGYTSLQ